MCKLKPSKGGWDLLIPSRFELCGLRDTVQLFNPNKESGFGWIFGSVDAIKFIHALANCLLTYCQYKKSWEGLHR